jgi:hypothetical protein
MAASSVRSGPGASLGNLAEQRFAIAQTQTHPGVVHTASAERLHPSVFSRDYSVFGAASFNLAYNKLNYTHKQNMFN